MDINFYQKRLSLIIPCYNSEMFICRCLDSLYQQDITEEEYEVIVVNDCSSDNSRQIIIDYQKKHNNLILIDHDKNKKQGGARNTGFDHASGTYIWFIDQDDYIKQNCFSNLLIQAEYYQLDFLQFCYEIHDNSGILINKEEIKCEHDIMNGIDYALSLGSNFLSDYNQSVWSRIYNRNFLLNGNFRFEENNYFEDLEYSLRTLLFANSIKIINESPYCYSFHPLSVMRFFSFNISGTYTYDTSIRGGISILNLSNDIKSKSIIISEILKEGAYWRINQIIKPLLYCKSKERYIFYSLLQAEELNKINDGLKPSTKYLLKNKHLAIVMLLILSPILRIFRKFYKKLS